ncbi:DUF4158 domain-containing protein [Streptomyces europaeiscabiei]|uniref:DUF4158 domain-containing protein n=1 Tax=Streptomyces europaeiscabiei TaxID=146819 RepID=UPI0013C4937E|nr:DUF4158 domain-containing protein [Streptomyces europaeiscabiei]
MASPERTAYPRFRKLISERELREFFTPSAEDAVWACERTRDRPGRVLALLVMLKSAARLGRVPKVGETPEVVVAHLRDQAGLAAGTVPEADSGRSEERCPSAVRERLGLRHKPGEARAVTEAAMWVAAPVKAHTADLVNVALEELVRHKGRLEMPAFSTLDRMASRVRSGVEASQYKAIVARMSDAARERVVSMLEVVEDEYQSLFAWIKQPARRATWSRFRAHAERTGEGGRAGGCRLLGGEDTAGEGGRCGLLGICAQRHEWLPGASSSRRGRSPIWPSPRASVAAATAYPCRTSLWSVSGYVEIGRV